MTEEQEVLSRFLEAIVELICHHPYCALPFLRRLPQSFVSDGDVVTADNANLGTARPLDLRLIACCASFATTKPFW